MKKYRQPLTARRKRTFPLSALGRVELGEENPTKQSLLEGLGGVVRARAERGQARRGEARRSEAKEAKEANEAALGYKSVVRSLTAGGRRSASIQGQPLRRSRRLSFSSFRLSYPPLLLLFRLLGLLLLVLPLRPLFSRSLLAAFKIRRLGDLS